MTTTSLKRTPLFETHQKAGARLVEFGGWEMPVQYTSIMDEHAAVRTAAGLFDISHMGEVSVTGSAAESFLNFLLTNDTRKIAPGQGQYTLMCTPSGGVVDDLYAYRLGPDHFFLVINASRIEPDFAWMQQQWAAYPGKANVTLVNQSNEFAAVALQGPKAALFVDDCFPSIGKTGRRPTNLKKNEVEQADFRGAPILIARTGYTGEDGFEIVAPSDFIVPIWDLIMETGTVHGLKPAGLGARDTLRTEACYPLYGHELDENTSPIEAGVGFFVALEKGDFIGRTALAEQKANGPKKRCVAFKMSGKSAPPRPGYPVYDPASTANTSAPVGTTVSGTQSPTLGCGIGLAYVPASLAKAGTPIEIEIRGKRTSATIVQKPFYKRS